MRVFKLTALTPLVFMLAACGTSPEPSYFTLAPVPGTIISDVHYAVKVQKPLLAGYLDRPEIVRQDSDYSVEIDDSRRWAEPLDAMFERVLLSDLQQRLPAAQIMDEDTATLTTPRVTLSTSIAQFNQVGRGGFALDGQLDVRDNGTHDQPAPKHIAYASETDAGAPANLSELVGKLADGIANLLHEQLVQGSKITPEVRDPAP